MRNAVCDHPSYRSSIVRQLTQLTILDGERLKHMDTVYQEDLLSLGAAPRVEIPPSENWLAGFSWDAGRPDPDAALRPSLARFETAMQDARKVNQAALTLLSHYK
mmetsp:Transcript_26861/g.70620  ORF Transcript_26861/g.70620 Transcript_26861/m.70620 type:complete len:105 (-) Transcript_26861:1202-1516(-)